MWEGNLGVALLLTLFAGLSTGLGGAVALLSKKTNTRFLSVALGFSAGVMIYVSFTEIMEQGKSTLILAAGKVQGSWLTAIAFFAGILVIAAIDRLIPERDNPHEMHGTTDGDREQTNSGAVRELSRIGMMSALAIAIHNFPEGLATFSSTLQNPKLGAAIAVAVAIHNIPEGIAVAVPIFYATGARGKAFAAALLSGLSEPVGAALGYLLLRPFLNDLILGLLFPFVAGIMVFISLDELLPAARAFAEEHLAIYGLVAGMAVMAVSLLLFMG